MWKLLAITCPIVLAISCKADAPVPAVGSATEPGSPTEAGHPGRSGKIDLGVATPRPSLPPDDARAAELPSQEALAARRKERMAALDKDGDGSISAEERATIRQQRAETMYARLDADGDGKVTAAELAASPIRRIDLSRADTNKDGVITVEELVHVLEARGSSGSAAPDVGPR
ncbi:MAG: hypothetical protein H6Q90_3306 [Deltaproteobacteria bacterium]|nr:hypothetical protein [Deltaproteobacteria bacterium]